MVELLLVQLDVRGHFTDFWGRRRHDWPVDVLSSLHGLRVASVAALRGYRQHHPALRGRTMVRGS